MSIPSHLHIDPRQRVSNLAGRPEEGPRFDDKSLSTKHWDIHYWLALSKREPVDSALNSNSLVPPCQDKWFLAGESPEYFMAYQTVCQLLWDSVHFQTYFSLDDIITDKWFPKDQPRPLSLGLLWHHNKVNSQTYSGNLY
jgi:hypothetical protein